jgi:chromosome segregation ATPase
VRRGFWLGVGLCVAMLVAGCGPDLKKENEDLKAQIANLQNENLGLKGQITNLKADADAAKKQVETLTADKQSLEDKLKDAEAKLATKPGAKPPLKPKKAS